MKYTIHFCILYLFILQESINLASYAPASPSFDVEGAKTYSAKRLRGPILGRSMTTSLDDDSDFVKIESNDDNISINNEEERLLMDLLSNQRWSNPKKKGPLFG